MKKRLMSLLLAGSVLLAAGCSSTGANAFNLAANTAMNPKIMLGIALAVYIIYDPLAPNWEIEEAKISEDNYLLSMKMKRFHTGGSGEALQILKRRATQLQRENGRASYQIVEYTEGIDSQTIGARRIAEGTIRLVSHQDADSYQLNQIY